MLSISYPKKYQNEDSRVGKKFKYYKVEPIDINKKEEKKKEIKIGEQSGRISTLENWRKNPQQGNINYMREDIFSETFSDLLESYLGDLNDAGYNIETSEKDTEKNSN